MTNAQKDATVTLVNAERFGGAVTTPADKVGIIKIMPNGPHRTEGRL